MRVMRVSVECLSCQAPAFFPLPRPCSCAARPSARLPAGTARPAACLHRPPGCMADVGTHPRDRHAQVRTASCPVEQGPRRSRRMMHRKATHDGIMCPYCMYANGQSTQLCLGRSSPPGCTTATAWVKGGGSGQTLRRRRARHHLLNGNGLGRLPSSSCMCPCLECWCVAAQCGTAAGGLAAACHYCHCHHYGSGTLACHFHCACQAHAARRHSSTCDHADMHHVGAPGAQPAAPPSLPPRPALCTAVRPVIGLVWLWCVTALLRRRSCTPRWVG